jgi:hypothetical protein
VGVEADPDAAASGPDRGHTLLPSERTINRILLRHGLALPRPRQRPRESFVRFERLGPMQLWQVDIVGGLWLVNPATGELREAKIVTGVDDHSPVLRDGEGGRAGHQPGSLGTTGARPDEGPDNEGGALAESHR